MKKTPDLLNDPFDLDLFINKILVLKKYPGKIVKLDESHIRSLLLISREILLEQPTLLEIEAPVNILGDIHGQFNDFLRYFDELGYPPDQNYLLLGDYVDRGKQSIETICLALAYKVKYPNHFFLLRGNHECATINRIYGFYDECKRRYNVKLWKCFTDVFNCLPLAAVVEDNIICMHGGISPEIDNLDQIRDIPRPILVPPRGIVCDLLWADPTKLSDGYLPSHRGVSWEFGPGALQEFLEKLDLSLVIRAHQVVEDGYEFFANQSLVTVFSVPNYCGEFTNNGAAVVVSRDLDCSFKIICGERKKISSSKDN